MYKPYRIHRTQYLIGYLEIFTRIVDALYEIIYIYSLLIRFTINVLITNHTRELEKTSHNHQQLASIEFIE